MLSLVLPFLLTIIAIIFVLAVVVPSSSTTIDAKLVISRPFDSTFIQDAIEFNGAPALNFTNSSSGTSSSSSFPFSSLIKTQQQVTKATAVYFASSEEDVNEALNLILQDPSAKRIQVRAGRHSYTALGAVTSDAAVLDVSNITFENDPARFDGVVYDSFCGTLNNKKEPCKLMRFPAGIRLFQMYEYLSKKNLYFPGGSCPSVGLGFFVGGGIGLYSRQHGLASQNIFGARVAQINGDRKVVWKNVSETENFDLLWALRGGGNNNFGVITELTLRVYPAPVSVSSMRVSTTSCVEATDAYQQFLEASSSSSSSSSSNNNNNNNNSELCNITATLYYYHDHCGIVVLSTSGGLTYDQLYSNYVVPYFVDKLPAATTKVLVEVKDENVWLKGCASVSGCSSVETCSKQAGEMPNVNGPSYWTAMSVQTNRSLKVNPEIKNIIRAVQAPLADTTCSFFPVIIIDGLKCRVSDLSSLVNISYPWTDALYHVQILAYNTNSNSVGQEGKALHCQNVVQQYVENIFRAYDLSLVDYKSSYRNYPNEALPNALTRYYGEENLKKLKRLVKDADPLKMFSKFSQGLN